MKIRQANSAAEIQNLKSVWKFGRRRNKFALLICGGLILSILPNLACVNRSLLKNNKNTEIIVEKNLTEFERDLETMKTANFDFIFVFRRKDAAAFDAEDKKFLRANTPLGTNRFVSTDENRAFIAGSLYAFSPENLERLRSRFLVEDYSKPEAARLDTNQNANLTASQNNNANR